VNIGLVAMSGIRVCDKTLLELGLTLPGFIERSRVIANLPSLGLLTLAGMTPDKHKIEYIEIPDLDEVDGIPKSWDIVAISSYSAQIDEAYALGDKYKEEGIPVVMGGLHVSSCPEEASKHCNAVVVGEGEIYWNEIFLKISKKDNSSGFMAILEKNLIWLMLRCRLLNS